MEKQIARAYLSLGSNLGDRIEILRQALAKLNQKAGDVVKLSSVYETEPVGFHSKDQFLNICIELHTSYDPFELLAITNNIEHELGRKKEKNNVYESRTLDIDVILFNDLTIETEVLSVPHPRFQERLFVLIPLNDIAKDLVVPQFNMTIGELLNNIQSKHSIKQLEIELIH